MRCVLVSVQQHKEQFKELIADIRRRAKQASAAKQIPGSSTSARARDVTVTTADTIKSSNVPHAAKPTNGANLADTSSSGIVSDLTSVANSVDATNSIYRSNSGPKLADLSYTETSLTTIQHQEEETPKSIESTVMSKSGQDSDVERPKAVSSKYFGSAEESHQNKGTFNKVSVTSPELLSDEDTRDSFKIPAVPKSCATKPENADSDSDIANLVVNNDDQQSLGSSINSVTFFTQKSHPDRQVSEFPDTSNDSLFGEESLMHYRFSGSQDVGVVHGIVADRHIPHADHGHIKEATEHIKNDGPVPTHMPKNEVIDSIQDDKSDLMHPQSNSVPIQKVKKQSSVDTEPSHKDENVFKQLFDFDGFSQETIGSSLMSGQFTEIKQSSSSASTEIIGR